MTPIKTHIAKTKQFVKDHRTVLACSATAVVTCAITQDIKIKGMKELVHNIGVDVGTTERQICDAYSFITDKGLWNEFADIQGHNHLVQKREGPNSGAFFLPSIFERRLS